MNDILITICARGGSKGIPGKNVKELNGKPLIAYTINIAKNISKILSADIALSTDADNIKNIARKYGVETDYERPLELASDFASKIDVINNILLYEENKKNGRYKYIFDLDITSPLRTVKDLMLAFQLLKNNEEALNIFSVSRAKRNPYFNMVEQNNKNDFIKLVKKGDKIKYRQTAPEVFDMNASFYIYRRSFFDMKMETPITNRSIVYLMPHICFDLDEPEDFIIMDIIIKNNLLDFDI